ncbi:MAG: S9 family peptidase [Opitutales bacterium]|nr:S9 family peptidase [Opitutales bacterium]
MKWQRTILALAALALWLVPMQAMQYPDAPRGDAVDTFHGVAVADPYRWLEDTAGEATQAWLDGQEALWNEYAAGLGERGAVAARLRELWDSPRYGLPQWSGDRYVFSINSGLQPHSVVYVSGTDELGDERVLLDPNTFSEDGTVSLAGMGFSPDGRYMGWGVSDGGSDWRTWRVRDMETGEDLPTEIRWSKFGGLAWRADGAGFYYRRYDPPEAGREYDARNELGRIHYHALGTDPADDPVVYDRPDDPRLFVGAGTDESGRYLIVSEARGNLTNGLLFADLEAAENPAAPALRTLVPDGLARFWVFGFADGLAYTLTNHQAERYRIVVIDPEAPEIEHWREIVPEGGGVIDSATLSGGRIVVQYLENVIARVVVHELDGTPAGEVALPGPGTVAGLRGRAGREAFYFAFTSFNYPTTIFRCDPATGESEAIRPVGIDFDPETVEVSQEFYESRDGARVPMFIVHRKGIERDGSNPVVLYGYGGFNVSQTPRFSVSILPWLERGGVYVMPNLRGGGEFGREWHQAGTRTRKQNTFDDFIAAAEWLIAEDYTRRGLIGTTGGSNGGLLTAAAMLQRPDLFGAVVSDVGVHDMLRYHRFTIGHQWATDYGTVDDPDEFAALLAYSPVHNVRKGIGYPPTLITTGEFDDRVVPAHSFKFAAALQWAQTGGNPVVLRVERRAGHGAGRPMDTIIGKEADRWAFFLEHLDAEACSGDET